MPDNSLKIYNAIHSEIKKAGKGKDPDLDRIQAQLEHKDCNVNDIKNEKTVLQLAAAAGLVEVCELILNTGVVEQDNLGKALKAALSPCYEKGTDYKKYYAVVKFLLEAGAPFKNDIIPSIFVILEYSDFNAGMKLLKLFLKHGANVNTFEGEHGYNLLTMAGNYFSGQKSRALVKLLLDHNINPELTHTGDGDTALMNMASGGKIWLCKMLLDYGADITMESYGGGTARNYAGGWGYNAEETRKFFDEQMRLLYGDAIADQSKSVAVESGAASKELSAADKKNEELFSAAHQGKNDEIKRLIRSGADVNYKDSRGLPVLYWPVRRGFVDTVKLLLAKGADIHAREKDGSSVLHWAKYMEMAKILLDHGADIKAKDNDGESVIYTSIISYEDDTNLMKFQVSNGADPNAKTNKGQTVLHKVARLGHIKQVEYLISIGVNVDEQDIYGKTPLHRAIQKNELAIVKCLLEAGANPSLACKLGKTPMDHAYTAEIKDILSAAITAYPSKKAIKSEAKASANGGAGAASSSASSYATVMPLTIMAKEIKEIKAGKAKAAPASLSK